MDYKGRVDAGSVLNSPQIEALVRARTEAVAAAARAFAPVETGQLKASIGTRVDKHSGVKRDRPVGVVYTDAHASDGSGYGAADEFGTSRSRGHYFLRRAAGVA